MNTPDANHLLLVIGVTTLGKRDLFQDLLESIKNQTENKFILGVCDQTDLSNVEEIFNFRGLESRLFFVRTSLRGASLGRNLILSNAPQNATHFFFPNDTSLLSPDFIEKISTKTSGVDVHVLSYLQKGKPRYRFESSEESLNKKNIWLSLESSTVFSSRLLRQTGGFDERIGTGSSTRYQSGEGTDLLFRALAFKPKCLWSPEIEVHGVTESYMLSRREMQKKSFLYGIGYGSLLSKYKFGFAKKFLAVLGPILKACTLQIDPVTAIFSSAGRCWGLYKFQKSFWNSSSTANKEQEKLN